MLLTLTLDERQERILTKVLGRAQLNYAKAVVQHQRQARFQREAAEALEIITDILARLDGNALTRSQALDIAEPPVKAQQRRHRVAAVAQR